MRFSKTRVYFIPDSFYFRYQCAVTATNTPEMIGTPVYTPFLRLETFVGSNIIDSINQWNQTSNLLINTTMDIAGKFGQEYSLGYAPSNSTIYSLNGRVVSASGETFDLSAPIPCMLTSCEKLIPAFCMPQIRFQFTMDALANMLGVQPTSGSLTITNFEVCYSVIDFGPAVEEMVRSMGTFYLKSQSFFHTAYNLPSGVAGSVTIPFNQSFQSIKSFFSNFSGTSSNSYNKWGDSYDITSSQGDCGSSIVGHNYPQTPLSAVLNKAGILQELRRAVGSIYGATNSLSINSVEFLRQGNDLTTTKRAG